jgi:hypothetical protein
VPEKTPSIFFTYPTKPAPSTSTSTLPNAIQHTHLVPRIHHVFERRDNRQPRTDGRFVVKHPPPVRPIGGRPDDTLVQLEAARKRLLVRRHDVDARVQETRVRLCDRLGRGVVHEDDFARFALCEAGQGVEQVIEARCLRTGIVECAGPPIGNEAASAIREEAHLSGVGDGSDADGVRTVRVDELLDELGAYATDPDDGEVEGMLTTDCTHGSGGCARRKVGDPMILGMA